MSDDERIDRIGRAVAAEVERLGLRWEDSPYGGGMAVSDFEAVERFVAHLQSLPIGATWRDVFPDMPAHWIPGRPETWTRPYKPYGDFDYQTLPAGPAFVVFWDAPGAGPRHDALVQRARDAGWPVYGGGITPQMSSGVDDLGFVVFELGTSEEVLDEFFEWILVQPGVIHTRPDRREDDVWA